MDRDQLPHCDLGQRAVRLKTGDADPVYLYDASDGVVPGDVRVRSQRDVGVW